MSKLVLYHGSQKIVQHPEFGKGKKNNDYGCGFYCTQSLDLAKEWACSELVDGYVNVYELDTASLKVLDLTTGDYSVLNWLAILLENRIVEMKNPIATVGKSYLLANFLPNYKDYDIIIGYRADDSYFSFARSFVENGISLKQLEFAMKLGNLGKQVVIKSERAFDSFIFKSYEVAESSIYYSKRKNRDEDARRAFRNELEKDILEGIFMRDIVRDKMRANDERLR